MNDDMDVGLDTPNQSTITLEDDDRPSGKGKKRQNPLLLPIGKRGNLENEQKIAAHLVKLWKSQDRILEYAIAQWKVNAARRKGLTNAMVYHDPDEGWICRVPRNSSPDVTPDMNKAATICRRMTSNLFTDPHIPQVASTREMDDEAAQELTERVLLDQIEQVRDVAGARRAFDKSHNFGSGYVHYIVDAKGSGVRKKEVRARPDATDLDNALVNPATGLTEGPYVKRFLTPEGLLTDDEDEAEEEWLPCLRRQVLDGRHVRLFPSTCEGIEDADMVLIASFITWGTLLDMAPEIETRITPEIKETLLRYRPDYADDLLGMTEDDDERAEDEKLVFTLTCYARRSARYPEGLYIISVADQYTLHRSSWVDDSDENDVRALDIPIAQYGGTTEGRDGYWKVGLMELVGGGNELRAAQISSLLDHLERLNNLKTFIPTNSTVTPEQLMMPRSSYIPVNPGGEPSKEEMPNFPAESFQFMELASREMDEASGLLDTSGALNRENVQSGRQAFAIISQVHAGLSEQSQSIEAGRRRGWKIMLQLVRAFFDTEQTLKYAGEDGAYREKAWSRTDLLSDLDISVQAGSGTMLAPAAKAQLAEHYSQLGIMDLDELREVIAGNIGGSFGIRENPFRMRIRRQIAAWNEGPPQGWREQNLPMQPVQPAQPGVIPMPGVAQPPQQPVVVPDPASGLPVIQDPVLAKIFLGAPSDSLPQVAQIRLAELAKATATARYERAPKEWKAGLDAEFMRMMMVLQRAQAPAPAPGQDGAPAKGEEKLPDGRPKTALHEDAMREGMPPGMAAGA